MFHIKTDIRQYKCESEDKVERLIRNWVIRPSDLIYNAAEKTWNPIGQHPSFNDIFAVIEQEEANEPDTVVTEAPSEIAAEHEVEPGSELGDAASEEITGVREAPTEPEEDAAASAPSTIFISDEGLRADSDEITNVTEAPDEPDEAEAPADDEVTDVREDPRADAPAADDADDDRPESADAASDPQDEAPAPPEAPEGVEGLIRDSDEITMMTDKTFEMLRAEAGKGGDIAVAEAPAAEETTDRVEREEVLEPADDAASGEHVGADAIAEEPTQLVDREEVLGEEASAPEPADEANSEETDSEETDSEETDSEETDSEETDSEEASPDEEDDAEEAPATGRHGLPEEVFVTDEIPRQGVQQAVIDELGELEEEDDDEVTELIDEEQRKPRWRIVMSDDLEEGSEPFEDDRAADGEPGETPDDAEADDAEADVEPEPADAVATDEELDEMLDEAAELVGLNESSEPVDIEVGELEPVDDDAPRARANTPVRAVKPAAEFVSEGYKLPLPVDISPSAEDIQLGLRHTRASRAVKDATFPYPQPKKPGELALREFDLDPEEPRDHSVAIVVGLVVGIVLVLIAAITWFG